MKLSFKEYYLLIKLCIFPQLGKLAILFLLLLAGIGIALLLPQLISHYVDIALDENQYSNLVLIGIFYIALTVINQGVQLGETYISEKAAWYATNTLRRHLTTHCLKLDLSFHKQYVAGELIERIDGDVSALANFFSRFFVQIIANGLLLIGIVVVLLFENIWIGMTFFLYICFSFLVLNLVRKWATPYWISARQANTQFYGALGDWLNTIEDVRPNGGIPYILNKFYFSMRNLLIKERATYIRSRFLWPVMIILFALGYVLVFWLGTYLLKLKIITLGVLFLMFYYMDSIRTPLEQITMEIEDLQKANACIKRILELLSYSSQVNQRANEELPAGALSVQVCNLTFSYHEGEPMLNNISFSLKAGEKLGIIGRTGSGKSTLIHILLRHYDFSIGEILLGGKSIKDISLKTLNQRVAVITQEPQLFHASIRDNVTMFQSHIPEEKVINALREVGLEDWLKDLPNGLDTILVSGRKELSAGQAQLLALARVFLQNPGLIIFDEVTSRMDNKTEKLILIALEKLFRHRTVIMIAHRMQTINKMDHVLVLDQGKVLEYGPKEQLEQDSFSYFYKISNIK